ncbi:hypothetical protein ACFFGT_25735 [Mucilaginibacter angelicae]|uniref:DUF3291 domain-containing protein n=1 Tax=Mucilaginibacter angelicae TaxID=869718 RepID=A0ABV6LDV1_9SPHI
MIFISVTRLRVHSLLNLLSFFSKNEASVKALLSTEGFLQGKELIDKRLTFWTVTLWKDIEAMKKFRNCDAHRKAMQKLPLWCDEAAYVHWCQEEPEIPDWETVYQKLITEGKITKVKKPSPQQANLSYTPVKWKMIERNLGGNKVYPVG